jgi:hypothetical protein
VHHDKAPAGVAGAKEDRAPRDLPG